MTNMFAKVEKPLAQRSLKPRNGLAIQKKLKVGPPNDKYEQEADAMADKVLSMPSKSKGEVQRKCAACAQEEAQTKPLANLITPLVQRQEEDKEQPPAQPKLIQKQEEDKEQPPAQTKLIQKQEEEKEEPGQAKLIQKVEEDKEQPPAQPKLIQKNEEEKEEPAQTKLIQKQEEEKEEPAQTRLIQKQDEEKEEPAQTKRIQRKEESEAGSSVESRLSSSKGGGSPLSGGTKDYMESRFGTDFSGVKVHTDSNAVQMNKELGAQAFTHGNDIYFNQGKYDTGSSSGKHLLAHELTHTVQQGGVTRMKSYLASRKIDRMQIQRNGPIGPIFPEKEKPKSKEVTVIDDSDLTGWLAAFTRTGEIYMTNVENMVTNILKAIGSIRISRLNILDHGNKYGIQIGNDFIHLGNINKFSKSLNKLRGKFTSGGFVHLQHCDVGQNLNLIKAFSKQVGAPVYAGTGAHNPIYRFNFGDYVRCEPSGECKTKVGRP